MSNGHRALAAAVITRAIKDAHGGIEPGTSKQKRQDLYREAKAFLQPDNPVLVLYCDALDLDPVALIEAVKIRGANFTAMARQQAHRETA